MAGLAAALLGALIAPLIVYRVILWMLQKSKAVSMPPSFGIVAAINLCIMVLAIVASYFGHDGILRVEDPFSRAVAALLVITGLWMKSRNQGVKS